MPHVIEPAKTGRAKCRACGKPIAAGTPRFGERLPNAYGDEGTETTHWFHVPCAACTRPDAFLELLAASPDAVPDREALEREARLGTVHRRLPRATSIARAATGRATCRQCREPIAKDAWRIALLFYEEGRFVPAGFIHVTCAQAYLETTDIMFRLRYFSPDLADDDAAEIAAQLQGSL